MSSQSVTLASSLPSTVTTHSYGFSLASTATIGSIVFESCDNTPLRSIPCSTPPGLSVSSAVLQSQTGETGFSIDPVNTTANKLIITRPPVASSAIPVTYTFDNITNPSNPKTTIYVRLATYASIDGTGTPIDEGTVAYSTVPDVSFEGYVPPYLTFCVGVLVAPNCASFSGVFLDFGELSTVQPRYLSSQFAIATNDANGYATYVTGPTMTSGNNTITGSTSATVSQPGTSQFGMNLRANTNPSVGADPAGFGTGVIAPGFDTPNKFFFNSQSITSSPIPSDFNVFTVSYIVNVNRAQPAGVYNTTLTYIGSAAF